MENGKELDPYAEPYIPQSLKEVNAAPAHQIQCAPPPWTDYHAYVNAFAGSYLTARPQPTVTQALLRGSAAAAALDEKAIVLDEKRYGNFFSAVLAIEILALQNQCERHNLYQVQLSQSGSNAARDSVYTLKVPGLRESSIPTEIGDIIRIRQLHFTPDNKIAPCMGMFTDNRGQRLPGPSDCCYHAVVWAVDRFNETLHLRIDNFRHWGFFNACFTAQETRIGALQVALEDTSKQVRQQERGWLRSILFPRPEDGRLQKTLYNPRHDMKLFDTQLNHEQVRAIQTILHEDYGLVPYLISGPPGTGKTKTVVELALQILAQDETKHLLLCAPSDSAADTLLLRLSAHLSPTDLLRLNSPARSFAEVPDAIMPYCYVDDRNFSLPPFVKFMEKQIVITTARDSQILRRARLTNADLFCHEVDIFSAYHPRKPCPTKIQLHWDALIMDEATQATELEALLPLLVVAPPFMRKHIAKDPHVVMVGDKHQLGPRTASKRPELQTSLFERLLVLSLYSDHPLARAKQHGGHVPRLTSDMLPIIRPPFTDLIRNYRSHPAILAVPSSLFYHDTLEPHADNTEALLTWPGFEGRDFPVLFHENRCKDEIEQDGGGWFNLEEAEIAINHAESFVHHGVRPNEICVMSPFRAQVKVLRNKARARRGRHMAGVNIGPLEAYQGLEFRVAIVCTTRSRHRFIDKDRARGLGVIHEAKRFNVALTRAKQGMIVIGNPNVLDEDENWAAFMAFCQRNGAWSGTHDHIWQMPHSRTIRPSRLEKQLHARQVASLDGGIRRLGLSGDADVATYEAGVAAEEAVAEELQEEEDHNEEELLAS